MSAPVILLPGDDVPPDHLPPATTNAPLRLGGGLRILSSPSTTKSRQTTTTTTTTNNILSATQAGLLTADIKRNTIVSVLPSPTRRYIPIPNDLIIAQIHHSSADYFHCTVTPHTPHALLGQLAFEGATKKTRPMLKPGELVYARVLSVGLGAGAEVELTCVNPATGRAEPGGLGPLVGGMVFDVSTGFAARLMRASTSGGGAGGSASGKGTAKREAEMEMESDGVAGIVVLEELGRRLEGCGGFEIAVGRNGRVWVDRSSGGEAGGGGGGGGGEVNVKATVAVGRCLTETDRGNLDVVDQRKLVARVVKEMKIDV